MTALERGSRPCVRFAQAHGPRSLNSEVRRPTRGPAMQGSPPGPIAGDRRHTNMERCAGEGLSPRHEGPEAR
jgi:hypothetical protein